MNSTLSFLQPKSAPRWATEEPVEEWIRPASVDRLRRERLPFGKRVSRALSRFLITFCIGVAATLAWQSHGDVVREMIASSHPLLGWLAPQAAPDAPSPELQQLKAMSTDVAAVRQSVDQLAAQFVAGQDQLTRDITKQHAAEQELLESIVKLHATEQDILENILDKIPAPPPRPAAGPARKPAPLTPLPMTPAPLTPPAAVR
jgi:hypothetical protein